MSVGPLRRSVGAVGLVALVPLAAMLATGALAPVDAARRAVVTLIVLLLLGRVAGRGLRHLATAVERADRVGEAITPDAARAVPGDRERADGTAPEVAPG